MSVAGGYFNHTTIGRAAWLNVIRPALVYGAEVVTYRRGDIEKLQKLQDKVGKYIMGLPTSTPSLVVSGELNLFSIENGV